MPEIETFIALLGGLVVLAMLAGRLRIPPPVAMVLGGLAVGSLPFVPEIRLSPDLVLLIFLPAIIYPAAFLYAGEDLRSQLRSLGALAVGLVLLSTAALAAVGHAVADVPWAPAFVLGAVLAPTDPVAATALLRQAGAPPRIATLLEGESLVNDGTGLAAFSVALGVVSAGSFSPASAAGEFVLIGFGGLAMGGGLGWLSSAVRRRFDQGEIEIAISVLTAYGAFFVAEELGVSGILATVAAGFVVGRRSTSSVSAETRTQGRAFWSVLRFVAESMLFLLVGLTFARVLAADSARPGGELLLITAVVAVATMGVRLALMFGMPALGRLVARLRGTSPPALRPRELLVLALGGMRGAVSVAAALSVPLVVGGEAFPERNTIVVVALGTVALTLVLPALGMPPLLKALGLGGGEREREPELEARLRLAHAALRRVEELADREAVAEAVLQRARERYERRITRLSRELEPLDGDEDAKREASALRHVLQQSLAAQREELQEVRAGRDLTGAALDAIERDLDLEELRGRR